MPWSRWPSGVVRHLSRVRWLKKCATEATPIHNVSGRDAESLLKMKKTLPEQEMLQFISDLHVSKEPVLITEHGQPSAYLVDVQDYEFMQCRLELLEGLSRGGIHELDTPE